MMRSLKELIGYTVRATDGEIGSVEDFYIDTHEWALRYLVLDSEGWLTDRLLLFSPQSLGPPRQEDKLFPLNLSKEMIKNSPNLERNRPLGRRGEIELFHYYRWPFYWNPQDGGGLGPGTVAAYPLVDLADQMAEEGASIDVDKIPHLNSYQKMSGYRIQARDGGIGHLDDFVVDDKDWKLLFMIADTGTWLSGKKVVVSPNWVLEVNEDTSSVQVDLNQETIRNSPVYDRSKLFDRDYKTQIFEYYSRRDKD